MTPDALRPYQQIGVEFLASKTYAVLADDPGLGKTVQAILAAKRIGAKAIHIVCPAIAVTNWQRHLDLWWPGNTCVKVASYEYWARAGTFKMHFPYPSLLIIDEGHYLKNRKAKRTRKIYGWKSPQLISQFDLVWVLTGTPAPNHAGEWYTHLRWGRPDLIPGRNGKPKTYDEFEEEFVKVETTNWGNKPVGNKNPEGLLALLKHFCLRRKTEDVLPDLPPLMWEHCTVDAGESLGELAELEKDPIALEMAAHIQKKGDLNFKLPWVQVTTMRRLIGEAKAKAIGRQIWDELSEDAYQNIVVGFHHRSVGARLFAEINELFTCLRIDGDTSPKLRQEAIDRFQAGEIPVLLVQMGAGGVAITLHGTNRVDIVEQSWVPAENQQFVARVHRFGQKRPVIARVWGLANSIDDSIAAVVVRKLKSSQEIEIETGEMRNV